MKITDMTDREQIANELKERLRWLEDNTVDEEYNIREAAAIKQLLRIMEPAEPDWDAAYFEPASAEQRFWDTYETRVDIEQEKEKLLTGRLNMEPDLSENILLKTEEGEKKPAQPQKKNLFLYFATHRWAAAAWIAAVLTVVILASGTVGAYAQSRGGVFHFFRNNEEGMGAMILPNSTENREEGLQRAEKYFKVEDIPDKYIDAFCDPPSLSSKYEMEYVKILDHHAYVLYESKYNEVKFSEYIVCTQKHYIDQVAYVKQANDQYFVDDNEEIEGIAVNYYISEDKEDSRNGAYFFVNKDYFTIYGDVNVGQIREFVVEIIHNYNN